MGCRWIRPIVSSLRMRKPASKRACANILLCRHSRNRSCASSMNINGVALGPTWLPGMSAVAAVFGRCETTTGIAPFDWLVHQVMSTEPDCSAKRVFWIIDNGSSHRGEKSIERLQDSCPTLVPVHTPIHASWLNQIKIYFSVIQRKVLTPNEFTPLAEVQDRLLRLQDRYEQIAQPFQ